MNTLGAIYKLSMHARHTKYVWLNKIILAWHVLGIFEFGEAACKSAHRADCGDERDLQGCLNPQLRPHGRQARLLHGVVLLLLLAHGWRGWHVLIHAVND